MLLCFYSIWNDFCEKLKVEEASNDIVSFGFFDQSPKLLMKTLIEKLNREFDSY